MASRAASESLPAATFTISSQSASGELQQKQRHLARTAESSTVSMDKRSMEEDLGSKRCEVASTYFLRPLTCARVLNGESKRQTSASPACQGQERRRSSRWSRWPCSDVPSRNTFSQGSRFESLQEPPQRCLDHVREHLTAARSLTCSSAASPLSRQQARGSETCAWRARTVRPRERLRAHPPESRG